MFINFYIKMNCDLFLDLFVSKKNQLKLYNTLKERYYEKEK